MPRKESKAVPMDNDPVHQQEESEPDQPTLGDVNRVLEGFKKMYSYFDQLNRKLKEITDEERSMDQHETSLEQDARQPSFAMEGDRRVIKKTRERTEGAVTAEQMMRGDNFSARRVEPGPKTISASVGMMTEPSALPCRDEVLVEKGDASPK